MMYDIVYNYSIGDVVFIVNENNILRCEVTQITLEIDPNNNSVVEIKTYHLRVISDNPQYCNTILLRKEDDVFPTSDMAVDRISGLPAIPPISSAPQTVQYKYRPADMVWTYDNQLPIDAEVLQITIDIDPVDGGGFIEKIIYHVLTPDKTHSVLLRYDYEVFDTRDEAIDYIQYLIELELTPTPTISLSASVTPTVTPTPTNLPPTPSTTETVTPTPTPEVTPTISITPSPVWPYILLD